MGLRTRPAADARDGKPQDVGRVPVVLPHLAITISDSGARLSATLNGEPYPVPAGPGGGRSALGPLVEQVTTELGCPVRIEVREADGSVFTEIVKPPPLPVPMVTESPASWERADLDAAGFGRLEVGGSGFAPDEQVAVAVVVAHQTAGPDGCARLRLPAALLASRPGTVVLLGRASGFVAVSGSQA